MISALCRLALMLPFMALPAISAGNDGPLLRPVSDPSSVTFRRINDFQPPRYTRHRLVTVHPDALWSHLESAQEADDISAVDLLLFRIFDDAEFHTQLHAVRVEYWNARATLTVVEPKTRQPIEPFGIVDLVLTREGELRLGIRLEGRHYHAIPAGNLPFHIVFEEDVQYLELD